MHPALKLALVFAALISIGGSCDRPSVLVVGLDGADWRVIDPLIDAGYLPTLRGLVISGARADLSCVEAHPASACFCPPVWTSIATGQPLSVHGIGGFGAPSTARKAPAIWEVLGTARAQKSNTLISYRNTWPPEDVATFVATEPGLQALTLTHFQPGPPPTHPGIPDVGTHAKPVHLFRRAGLLHHSGPRPIVFQSAAQDRFAFDVLNWTPKSKLTMILLHSPDKSEHLTWCSIQSTPGGPIDEGALLAQAAAWAGPIEGTDFGTVASQYLEMDHLLGLHLAARSYDTIFLVSDHGMDVGGFCGAHGVLNPAAHTGVFLVSGEGVAADTSIGRATVLDVAPTLAYALRLPVAQDLPGRVLIEGFTADHQSNRPIHTVPSWD